MRSPKGGGTFSNTLVNEAIDAGARDHIRKHLDDEDAVQTVRKVLAATGEPST